MAHCMSAHSSAAIFLQGLVLTSMDVLDLEVKIALRILDTHTYLTRQSSSI